MIHSIMHRKSSPLLQRAWLTEPWARVPKSLEQRIYDKGFVLGSLLEESDLTSIEHDDTTRSISLLQKLIKLDRDLRNLDKELSDCKSRSSSRFLSILDVTVCGLQQGTVALIWPLLNRFTHRPTAELTHPQPALKRVLNEAQSDSSAQRGNYLSHRVLDSAHACLDDSMGSSAAVKCILPLQLMKWSFIPWQEMAEVEADRAEIEADRQQILRQLQGTIHIVRGLDTDISTIPWIIVEAVQLDVGEAHL